MFRRLLLSSFLALLSVSAFAATPITVSGTSQSVSTVGMRGNSFVRFRLRNFAGFVPRVSGTGILVQIQLDVIPASNGSFTSLIWSNDDIVPNTCGTGHNQACTFYTVEFWNSGRISSSGNYCIPNTSATFDLNTATPCITPPLPSGPIQVTNIVGGQLSGTLSHILKFVGPVTAGDSEGIATGLAAVDWPLGVNVGTEGVEIKKENSPSPGTTQFLLAAKDPATGLVRDAQNTDNNSLLGITKSGAGTSGLASIIIIGSAQCIFDNQTSINDWVILGSNSQCHDAGVTQPVGVTSIGKVTSVNTGAATLASVDVGLAEVTSNSANTTTGGNGTVSPCATVGALTAYLSVGNTVDCDPLAVTDGAGNLAAKSLALNGTGGGFQYFGQGAAPTLAQANAVYFYAPASVATSFGTAWPSAPGTAGQSPIITSVPDATHVVLGYATPIITTPSADQTITGAHALILSNAGARIQAQVFRFGLNTSTNTDTTCTGLSDTRIAEVQDDSGDVFDWLCQDPSGDIQFAFPPFFPNSGFRLIPTAVDEGWNVEWGNGGGAQGITFDQIPPTGTGIAVGGGIFLMNQDTHAGLLIENHLGTRALKIATSADCSAGSNVVCISGAGGFADMQFGSLVLSGSVIPNDLGSQTTTVGNLINSGLSASLPVLTNGSKQLVSSTVNIPSVKLCGTTTTCANTVQTSPIIVYGDVTFPTATTVSLSALPFASASSYSCTASDLTTVAGVVNFTTYTSGAAATLTETGGTNVDHARYICVGN